MPCAIARVPFAPTSSRTSIATWTQFAASVERRGGHVHWADTADDARRIVAEIATSRGVRHVVKSKSMVSEELELNGALEAAGVRVVETDLGEFVAQVGGEHPSHIIGPILHKSKEDVADAVRAEARRHRQRRRGRAPHGGVRAAPAAGRVPAGRHGHQRRRISAWPRPGSICIATNEGNGRLTTTVPRVHVALMGIERVVPTLADLGLMLQLLARSATGQPLTVYTNIISGPRRRDRRSAHLQAGRDPGSAARWP